MTAAASAERSLRGKRARTYGHDTERMVVRWLRANGYPDARRYLSGDGRQPGDVDFHPLVVLEVKGRKGGNTSWPTWCRQAAAESSPGQVPVVVFRTPGVADAGSWECRVSWRGWREATDNQSLIALLNLYPVGESPLRFSEVAESPWLQTTFAEFIAALRRFDTLDGAS